jgi:histidinol-phosphate aminotransferase
MSIVPKASILDISPYVGGEATIKKVAAHPARLTSNEGALGPSPAAVAALAAAAGRISLYPSGAADGLRSALGARWGLNPAQIVCGNGSDDILSLLAYAYLNEGDEALHSTHAFLLYPIATRAAGATPVAVPETNLTADLDAFLAAVTPRTRLVWLANPNNPTGTYVGGDALRRFRAALRPDILLVLDGAYAEFADAVDYQDGSALVDAFPNVVMTRTFSKAFALAGARIGWGYAPPAVVDVLHRIRGPFNVNGPAQAAGVAACEDRAHYAATIAHTLQWRSRTSQALNQLGFPVTPSQANFVLMHCGLYTQAVYDHLAGAEIFVRPVHSYGLPEYLRVSIGSAPDMQRFLAAMEAFER